MKPKGSSDPKQEISYQSHLAETPDQQNLPQSRTARIGGGPLLRDSNKSRLSPLQIGVSPTWQKLPTSKTRPDLTPSGSAEDRLKEVVTEPSSDRCQSRLAETRDSNKS